MTLGLPLFAQQSAQPQAPAEENSIIKQNEMFPKASRGPVDAFNAPQPLFGKSPGASFDILPGAQPPMYLPNPADLRKAQDARNWTLMTPEQILGIPTPEKIMGLEDSKEDARLTPAERFLLRQQRQASGAFSNSLKRAESLLGNTPGFGESAFKPLDGQSPFEAGARGLIPDRNRNFDAISAPKPSGLVEMNSKGGAWDSPFNFPTAQPKPTPAQLEGMDRFRSMLSGPAPEKVATAPFATPLAKPSKAWDEDSSFRPAGRTYTGLHNDIAKPKGVAPLAGVTGPLPQPAKPAPLVQTPPWMQSSLDSGIAQKRQF